MLEKSLRMYENALSEIKQGVIENEEKLYELLQSSFSDSSGTLYEDIQENDLEQQFVDYIFEKFESEKKEPVVTDKTPYELLDEAGYVLADETTRTNIPGVFAVGDMRQKPLRQIVTAVADGAVASKYAEEFIYA